MSLEVVNAAEALERAADPGEFVVMALERGKSWLAEALSHNDLDTLANIKGWAETLRVATAQKQLGKDAELSAQELVRRAERCIGLGIRQGQEAGVIRAPGQSGGPRSPYQRNGYTVRAADHVPARNLISPTEYISNAEEIVAVYAMTDNVTDEEFEQAIAEAKDERNLSRANVVRKANPRKAATPKAKDRHEIHRKARRIDADRIIDESIALLEGIASGLALIEDVQSLDAEKRLVWLDAIAEPLTAITRFKKELAK